MKKYLTLKEHADQANVEAQQVENYGKKWSFSKFNFNLFFTCSQGKWLQIPCFFFAFPTPSMIDEICCKFKWISSDSALVFAQTQQVQTKIDCLKTARFVLCGISGVFKFDFRDFIESLKNVILERNNWILRKERIGSNSNYCFLIFLKGYFSEFKFDLYGAIS